jgi:hypothetical protein
MPPEEMRKTIERLIKAKAPGEGESYPELQEQLDALYSVLGKATLIPVKIWGQPDKNGDFTKGRPLFAGWPQITYAQSISPDYQRLLCDRLRTTNNKLGLPGNIAVLLGTPSDNLVAIDIDRADLIEPFLEANPPLRFTLRIATFRGEQLFLRMVGKYPGQVYPILVNGESVGEFRGGRALSTVLGFHSRSTAGNPVPYRFICTEPVMPYVYDKIVCPAGMEIDIRETKRKARPNPKNRERARARLALPGAFDLEALREVIGCDVERICEELFPNGRMVGSEFRLADKTGREPKNVGSLAIQTRGDYAGTWVDWTTHESGDVLDLVQSVYGETFPLAVGRVEALLGKPFRVEAEQNNPEATSTPPPPPTNIGTASESPASSKRKILLLPSAHTEYIATAQECFSELARVGKYFVRDGMFVSMEDTHQGPSLHVMDKREFVSEIEHYFELQKIIPLKDGLGSVPARCTTEQADVLLKTRAMKACSLPLRLIAASPVLIEKEPTVPFILGRGYHRAEGGIYVLKDLDVPDIPLEEAVKILTEGLFADYNWITPSDLSRAVAQTLSPALKLGNLLPEEDFPLDVALGDKSQSGKTHRMKCVHVIYGEQPYTITNRTKGGVGGLDESIGSALVSGKLFILFDNIRGDFDSQLLESILRGSGSVAVRIPHRAEFLTSTKRTIIQLTSNAANMTRDTVNRSIITNHRKQPDNYQRQLPWGEAFIKWLQEEQASYLGAVHSVVAEWIRRGKPRTEEPGHNFHAWVQAMDWIVTEIFRLPKLMEGHSFVQDYLSNRSANWFRQVVLAAAQTNELKPGSAPVTIHAADMVSLCDTYAIDIPGVLAVADSSVKNTRVGQILAPLFKATETVTIEQFQVRRIETRGPYYKDTKAYVISCSYG